ncbi:MAG: hypothetical protein EPN21_20710, partial [Methylococcaceae bacterium]
MAASGRTWLQQQSNRKTHEGTDPVDRNAQFEYIDAAVQDFLNRGSPVISV